MPTTGGWTHSAASITPAQRDCQPGYGRSNLSSRAPWYCNRTLGQASALAGAMSTESKTLWGSLAHSGAKLQQGDGSKRLLCRGFARTMLAGNRDAARRWVVHRRRQYPLQGSMTSRSPTKASVTWLRSTSLWTSVPINAMLVSGTFRRRDPWDGRDQGTAAVCATSWRPFLPTTGLPHG